ncbi:MAG: hypothetical protein DWI22_03895 [Planctomycetota bacterium]|nr:MAG: hypothetical protein DWI22_03895 [Planctomycetota bacterium]
MRQLAGPKTRYWRAHAAPLAGLNSDCAEHIMTALSLYTDLSYLEAEECVLIYLNSLCFTGDTSA